MKSKALSGLIDHSKKLMTEHMKTCKKCRNNQHEGCGFFMFLARNILQFRSDTENWKPSSRRLLLR